MKFRKRLTSMFPSRTQLRTALVLAILMTLSALTLAQTQPQSQSQSQQQAQANGAIRVARISLIEGEVSYQRGDSGRSDSQNSSGGNSKNTDWYDATVNTALEDRDQVFSGRNGRTEIQFSGRTLARLDRETNLRIQQFSTSSIQLAQSIGTATYRVDNLDRRQYNVYDVREGSIDDPIYFEVATPTVAVIFNKEGVYRINVRDDGTTEIIVRKGQAEVYNQELGTIPVKSGRRIIIEGRDTGYYQIAKLNDKDNWDRWNDRRDDDFYARSSDRSSRYLPTAVAGAYDLDAYGDWIDTPDYGYLWAPRGVAAGWAPYRSGAWRYHSRWGWTWNSFEPWGWAPYHYGRWTYYRSRWLWSPFVSFNVGRVGIGFWDWSPHVVSFFGWGNSYNRGYRDGYRDAAWGNGWTGWCPLGFGERWGGGYYDRWYNNNGRNGRTVVNNNYTIINNNTTIVRSIDSLRNYSAPGAVAGVDGRRFENQRVVADNLTPPPNGGGRGSGRGVVDATPSAPGANNGQRTTADLRGLDFVQPEVFKPTQVEIARKLPVERESTTARALDAPVVARRPVNAGNADGESNGYPARYRGEPLPKGGNSIERSGGRTAEGLNTPNRESTLEGVNRPERRSPGEYRPVERVERPSVTRPATEDPRSREMPARGNSSNSSASPARNTDSYERRDTIPRAPQRNERYEMERQPMPERQAPRRSEPQRSEPQRSEPPREYRVPERSAPRESAPPQRESRPERSAPERSAPERSAPPPREAAPARPERPAGGEGGRSMPSRKSGPDSL